MFLSYPKIVLALGGGGARGFAHIGVLQVLSEEGIQISGITGTSMGALIGSVFAVGSDLYFLEKLVEHFQWEVLVDLKLTGLGLVDGAKIQALIDLLTKGKRFEDAIIPFWAVATDLNSGKAVVFKKGPLAPAIRASISIPGIFHPIELDNRVLVDGAVVAGIPVEIAGEMEHDLLIAVNVGFDHTQHQVRNVLDVFSKVVDIMGNRLDEYQVERADLTIFPQLGPISSLSFQQAREIIALGRVAAKDLIPKIKALTGNTEKKSIL